MCSVDIQLVEEGNIFNNAIKTSYLWLYGARHMVKDHSDSESRNHLPLYGLLFPTGSKDSFFMYNPTDRIAHTMLVAILPVVEHWLEQETEQVEIDLHH